jgi:hypothetical protein
MSKKITKISFKESGQSGVSIGYTTFDAAGLKDKTTKECPHPPHIAFTAVMQKLVWHLLFLCEFNSEDKYAKFVTAENEARPEFRVCGVSISGEGDKEGVVITGYKTLSNGLGFVFNTPNTKFDQTEYKFVKELCAHLEELKQEADEYLGGKYGAVQGDLFNGEDGEPAPQA